MLAAEHGEQGLGPRAPQGLENALTHGVQEDQLGELSCPVLQGQLHGATLRATCRQARVDTSRCTKYKSEMESAESAVIRGGRATIRLEISGTALGLVV